VNTIPSTVDMGDNYLAVWVGDRVQAVRPQKRLRRFDGSETELVGNWINTNESFDVDWLIVKLDRPDYPRTYRTPWGTIVWEQNVKRVGDTALA
jgi:hypothetical protein